MPKHVITQQDVTQALAEGKTELTVRPDSIVTALAAEEAQQRGIRLVLVATEAHQAPPEPTPAKQRGFGRDEIRSAVIAHVGSEPEGLDRVLDRVLGR